MENEFENVSGNVWRNMLMLTIWQPFAGNIFKCIFVNENFCISNNSSLEYVPTCLFDNKSTLVQIMTWCQTGAISWTSHGLRHLARWVHMSFKQNQNVNVIPFRDDGSAYHWYQIINFQASWRHTVLGMVKCKYYFFVGRTILFKTGFERCDA